MTRNEALELVAEKAKNLGAIICAQEPTPHWLVRAWEDMTGSLMDLDAAAVPAGRGEALATALEKALPLINVAIPGRDCMPERNAITETVAFLRTPFPAALGGGSREKALEEALESIKADFEMNYVDDGKIVDRPSTCEIAAWKVAKKALATKEKP